MTLALLLLAWSPAPVKFDRTLHFDHVAGRITVTNANGGVCR